MTHDLWKIFVQQAVTVLSYFESAADPPPIQVGPLTLQFGRFNNMMLLHLKSPAMRLSITRDTAYNLFNLKYCVDHTVNWLNHYITTVDAKYKLYAEIAAANPAAAYRLIRENEAFDAKNPIDCELLAQVFAFL